MEILFGFPSRLHPELLSCAEGAELTMLGKSSELT